MHRETRGDGERRRETQRDAERHGEAQECTDGHGERRRGSGSADAEDALGTSADVACFLSSQSLGQEYLICSARVSCHVGSISSRVALIANEFCFSLHVVHT